MLDGLKVLDLTTGEAALCGRLLADMGADVRHWLVPELADSAALRACTVNQRCERLDWRAQSALLHETLRSADVLIHEHTDAQMQALDLAPEELEQRYPQLLLVSITAFGASGPKAGYAATDLIALAASGHLALSGAAQSAPVRIRAPQAFAHGASDAAVGVLIALAEREHSGRGQRLDVSAQQSTTLATLSRSLDGAVGQPPAQRAAYAAVVGATTVRNQYRLADGFALVLPGILPPLAAFMQRLVRWLHEAGHCADWVLEQDWGAAGMQLATGTFPEQRWAELEAGIAALLQPLTKAQVMQVAIERRLLLAPILSVADVLASDHAQARAFVVTQDGKPRLGAFAQLHGSPLPLGPVVPANWSEAAHSDTSALAGQVPLPLAGVKVLDLFWVVAGPGATRMLADYGATVIHVESRTRLDMVRNVPPYVDGVQEPERAACHHSTNANKLNLSLDLSKPEARPVLDDLIRWADVVTESFAPGVAERLGFGRGHVAQLNPNAIYVSSCLMGQDGPWRDYAGYGNTAAAVSGFHALTGHPEQPPMGCFGPYTDFLSVRFNALAILAALRHRQHSGRGQFVDMSQAQAALQFLLPECQAVFEGTFEPGLRGNDDPELFPHGLYPTAGEDEWLALAVVTDAHWQALTDLLQKPQWRAHDLQARRDNAVAIEQALQALCRQHSAAALQEQLQSLGIPAHQAVGTAALAQDPQLHYREHYIETTHASVAGTVVESTRLRFSRTQARTPQQAPSFGSDNDTVLGTELGYTASAIQALKDSAVLQ